MDDQDLMSRIKCGNQEAFIDLVNCYKKRIIVLCYSYTNDGYEAEDLSQDVFITFYRSANKFRGECSIATYLYKIALSKCKDFKRKKSIKFMLFNGFSKEKGKIEELDEKLYIRECINELPNNIKIPIVLYYYVGLDQKEIGRILNVSVRTVEGRIYRGKNKLKNIFSKEGIVYAGKMGLHR
ncbi:RNA polymerase sigma-70 factor, ECF subfamily [Clostridium acidisoli DSM 12555]|uniref:RNA polymerase sigma-70 factor, ECF subfamily n=1 Tax=Clostridium acidisoli DSM 12555 TaxID=1121291 RepID=A0A1W1XK86_9CLOT|nr:RNA polymerase sigma factor [Clostridium acidisoli]SMC24389.1 RNA polymerase sigma-70 factor, ECF subfamily [Clostridium acidisoli DSM 12555]